MAETILTSIEFHDAIAPTYDSKARRADSFPSARLIFDLVSPHLGPDQKQILDVGIGTGLSSQPFFDNGCVITGVDGSQKMLEVCRQKAIASKLLKVDFARAALPLQDGQYDAVISANTFYSISPLNYAHILGEMHRVTKPGGLCAFNYEVNPHGSLGYRSNDATMDRRYPRTVSTFSAGPQYIRQILSAHASRILEEDTRQVAQKMEGQPIIFETLVCRRLG